jgi:chlorobactene lauroyltransferase
MITAHKIHAFSRVFSFYSTALLKNNFARIMIGGESSIPSPAAHAPTIFFANHSSWWDAILPFYLSVGRWGHDSYAMMDELQLKKYFFFRWVGTFSVDRAHPRESVRSIDYAAHLLRGTSRSLWIYPQGELLPNDTRPLAFFRGVEHIARRIGTVNLVPIAFRYEFLQEQRPTIFIRIGEPVCYGTGDFSPPGSLTRILAMRLTAEVDTLRSSVIAGKTGDYFSALQGRRSMSALFESTKQR